MSGKTGNIIPILGFIFFATDPRRQGLGGNLWLDEGTFFMGITGVRVKLNMVKPGRIKLVHIMAIPQGHFLWPQTHADAHGQRRILKDLGSGLTNGCLAGEVNEIICQYD